MNTSTKAAFDAAGPDRMWALTWLQARPSYGSAWMCGVHVGLERTKACLHKKVTAMAMDREVVRGVGTNTSHLKWAWLGRPGGRTLYVTLARDPVDRVISEYHHSYDGWQDPLKEGTATYIPSDFTCDGTNIYRQKYAQTCLENSTMVDSHRHKKANGEAGASTGSQRTLEELTSRSLLTNTFCLPARLRLR